MRKIGNGRGESLHKYDGRRGNERCACAHRLVTLPGARRAPSIATLLARHVYERHECHDCQVYQYRCKQAPVYLKILLIIC